MMGDGTAGTMLLNTLSAHGNSFSTPCNGVAAAPVGPLDGPTGLRNTACGVMKVGCVESIDALVQDPVVNTV